MKSKTLILKQQLLLGGLGRYFLSKKHLKDLKQTPEETTNFLTEILINGIKMEKS